MKVPVFKAKDINRKNEYEGFYFRYPRTMYCFTEDYESSPVEFIHCLAVYRTTDWGLPNEPAMVVIDKDTLQKVDEVEVSEKYYKPKYN